MYLSAAWGHERQELQREGRDFVGLALLAVHLNLSLHLSEPLFSPLKNGLAMSSL